jgi:hypothetical protein
MGNNNIRSVVQNLNYTYFLPGIQRTFEWSENDICKLYDSLMRDIPIGQITIWTLSSNSSQFEEQLYYTIMRDYISDGLNPITMDKFDGEIEQVFEEVDEDGRLEKHPEDSIDKIRPENRNTQLDSSQGHDNQKKLVIDGQQRLTALSIGMNGCIIDYESGRARKKIGNWGVKYLYMNIAKDPSKQENGTRYEFKFKWEDNDLIFDEDQYWFRVNKVFDPSGTEYEGYERENYINEYIKEYYKEKYNESYISEKWEDISENMDHNLEKLDKQLTKNSGYDIDSVIYSTNETSRYDGDRQVVKKTFFRLNNLGTKVSKEQKLLAKSILNWAYGSNEDITYNPRDDIYKFINSFNSKFSDNDGSYFKMDLGFLFECLSAVSRDTTDIGAEVSDSDVQDMLGYWIDGKEHQLSDIINDLGVTDLDNLRKDEVEDMDFSNSELDEDMIRKISSKKSIKSTIIDVHSELADMGLTRKTGIESTNILIPIIYFKHRTGADLNSDQNKSKIKKFILATRVSNVIQSPSSWVNPILEEMSETLSENRYETFPYEKIREKVNESSQNPLVPVKGTIISNLDDIMYSKNGDSSRMRYILYYLRSEFVADTRSEVDHIFKQELFEEEYLRNNMGLDENQVSKFKTLENSLWNLQLLRKSDHNKKTEQEKNGGPENENDDEKLERNKKLWFKQENFDDSGVDFHEEFYIPESIQHFSSFEKFVYERRKSIIQNILNDLLDEKFENEEFESTYSFEIEPQTNRS